MQLCTRSADYLVDVLALLLLSSTPLPCPMYSVIQGIRCPHAQHSTCTDHPLLFNDMHLVEQMHQLTRPSTHIHRSYQGFTCLMQLSTRSADYLVDVLALRPHVGPALARLFADPSVVKVLHGADSDVVWLQVSRVVQPDTHAGVVGLSAVLAAVGW